MNSCLIEYNILLKQLRRGAERFCVQSPFYNGEILILPAEPRTAAEAHSIVSLMTHRFINTLTRPEVAAIWRVEQMTTCDW